MYWVTIGMILVIVGLLLYRLTRTARSDIESVHRYQPNAGAAIVLAFGLPIMGLIFVIAGLVDILA